MRRARFRRRRVFNLTVVAILAAGAWLRFVSDPFEKSGEPLSPGDIRVVDGDTINHRGERIRLFNIDAPEMPGRAGCAREGELALEAKSILERQVRSRALVLLHRQTVFSGDQYGRTLARITVDGIDVSDTLRKAGVTRRYGFTSGWC